MIGSLGVVIVGAGPYGLSLAAHFKGQGIPYRIFGTPMSTWRSHMPKGMFLKSEAIHANLWEPEARFTFKYFCEQEKIVYDDTRIPVSLEAFTAYAEAFQRRFVPEVEDRQVVSVKQADNGFQVQLDSGENVKTRHVLLAVGISHFQYTPPQLTGLPGELLSHSFAHGDVAHFRGQNVTVFGAGAGAMDLAALLHEVGADVLVVARKAALTFHNPPEQGSRSLWQRVRYPQSGIGRGLQSKLFANAPQLFYHLPYDVRAAIVRRHLGPAGSWTVKDRVVNHVPLLVGHELQTAEEKHGRAHLTLIDNLGNRKHHVTSHVISATGYKPDLRRLTFLNESIRSRLSSVYHAPVLSQNFQSSIEGLYFVGLAAANSFGPASRFIYGAKFAAQRISNHLDAVLKSRSPSALSAYADSTEERIVLTRR